MLASLFTLSHYRLRKHDLAGSATGRDPLGGVGNDSSDARGDS